MAHFAELKKETDPTGFTTDKLFVIQRVVVVSNEHVPIDEHVDGEAWCIRFFGLHTTWKQTSYNDNFRKQYAGIGDTYDYAKNKFILKQPYASWSLDANDDWKSSVTYPTIKTYGDPAKSYVINWDEPNLRWTAKDAEDPQNSFNWDSSGLAWVSA